MKKLMIGMSALSAAFFALSAQAQTAYVAHGSMPAPVVTPGQLAVMSDFSKNTNNHYDTVKNTSIAGRFNDVVRFLADQLAQNRDLKNINETHLAIASLVALDDISRTNKLGFLIQEHLMHELQARGFRVIDFKLMNDQIQVTKDGDFAFSRDPKRLRKSYDIGDVVSGTYSFQGDGVVLNLRAVDTKTGVITSTAQGYLTRGDYEYLLNGKPAYYYNGEYFYQESQRVKVVDVPVSYSADHNKVNIVK